MAWSVESRVPFLDYRLAEFVAGLPDHLKIRLGVSKFVLREAMHGVLPEAVRQRRDKMGFATPERTWLSQLPDLVREGSEGALAAAPELFDSDRTRGMLARVAAGTEPFSFATWRIVCLGQWLINGTAPSRGRAGGADGVARRLQIA